MTETPARPPPVVTYWAISILNSKTFRTNVVIILASLSPILALPEVVALLSPRLLLIALAGTAAVNIVLRRLTVRPVAFIPPNTTVPVDVPKIDPPTTETD
jgi:hypothetical protein